MTLREEIDALCRRIAAAGDDYPLDETAHLNHLLLNDAAAAGLVADGLTALGEVGVLVDHLARYGWRWEMQANLCWRLVPTEEADQPIIVEVQQ